MRARTLRKTMRLLTEAALLALLGPALLAAAPALADGHDDDHAEDSAHEHCEVTIENTGEAALSPGVWLVHHDRDALWGPGLAASEAVEQLVETGDNSAALGITDHDHQAMEIPAIQPGESVTFEFENEPEGVFLSTINRLTDSNDSFVGVANVRLFTDSDEPVLEERELLAFDAGTEENEPRGEASDDNGTPTEGGMITENNPQYDNTPQARLTVRCETVDVSHEEAVAIREAGGDPFAAGDEDADMPSESDADADAMDGETPPESQDGDAEMPAEPSDADDGETDAMPSEPQQDDDAEMPAEPSDADDGEMDAMPSEPDADGDAEMPAEPSEADDGETDTMPSEPQDGDAEMPAEPSEADDGEMDAMPSEPQDGDAEAPDATEESAEDDSATAPRVGTGLAPAGDGGQTLAILLALAAAVAALGGATLALRRARR